MRTGIVAFLIGNICLLYWPELPDNHSVLLIFGLLLFLTGILFKARPQFVSQLDSLAPKFKSIVLFFLIIILGFTYTTLYINEFVPVLDLKQRESKTITIKGQVDSIVQKYDKRQKFIFDIASINATGETNTPKWDNDFSGKVQLSWYDLKPVIKIGQTWQFDVRLKKPNGLLNPGVFDYEKWLYQNRILATGYVRNGIRLSDDNFIPGSNFNLKKILAQIRQKVSDTLDQVLQDYPYKGLVKALAIGYRAELPSEHWNIFLSTGTNHLIAISGLHIGLVAALIWFFTDAFWRLFPKLNLSIPSYKIASIAAFLIALIYAALAGFAIPTQRALIMLSVVLMAIILKREFSPSYVLMMALLLVLLIDPLSPLSSGFWLSFGAVAVILWSISARLSIPKEPHYKLFQLGRLQLIIFLGLIPLMLINFHQLSVIAPIANIIAVPLMSIVIVPAILISTLVSMAYEPLSAWMFQLIGWPIGVLMEFLQYLTDRASNLIYFPHLPWLMVILLCAGCIWLLMPRGWPGRWLGIFLILPIFWAESDRPEQGDVQITVLDVGQGLSMLVQTQHHNLLFDTGDKYSERFNMADTVIIPYLRYKGISKLDTLVISHSDSDHAGSLNELLDVIPVSLIMSGEADVINVKLSSKPVKKDTSQISSISSCQKGQNWVWDNVVFKVLSPEETKSDKSANNRSCVLLIASQEGEKFLLTGDIEKKIEKQLLKDNANLKVKFLQVPHHGSNTSSSNHFIQKLEPEIAVFSHGYKNRFKHPSQKVMSRYKKLPIKLYSTNNGAIDISRNLSNNSLSVTQYRLENKRFWHREAESL